MTATSTSAEPLRSGRPDEPGAVSPEPVPAPIRRAIPTDAAALTTLARAAKASWDYPAGWLSAWEAELSFSAEYVTGQLVFVIDGAGDQPTTGDPFPIAAMCALERHDALWHLGHVWVAPGAQRQGLGSRLVRYALAEAKRQQPGLVLVDADPNAAEFYRRLGGEPSGVRTAPMPGAPDRTLPRFTFGLAD